MCEKECVANACGKCLMARCAGAFPMKSYKPDGDRKRDEEARRQIYSLALMFGELSRLNRRRREAEDE